MNDKIPLFLKLSLAEQKSTLEALIFASDEAISTESILSVLISAGIDNKNKELKNSENEAEGGDFNEGNSDSREYESLSFAYINQLVEEINRELIETGRPFQIVNVAGGWLYATRREYGELLSRLNKSKSKRRLSQASLEVLAIVSYRQPVTKPEIEHIRGVNSSEVINSLIEKGFVDIAGRKETLGKPLLYCTTNEFLKAFGLNSTDDLPKLRELEEFSSFESLETNNIEIRIDELNFKPDVTDFLIKDELMLSE